MSITRVMLLSGGLLGDLVVVIEGHPPGEGSCDLAGDAGCVRNMLESGRPPFP